MDFLYQISASLFISHLPQEGQSLGQPGAESAKGTKSGKKEKKKSDGKKVDKASAKSEDAAKTNDALDVSHVLEMKICIENARLLCILSYCW